MNIFLVRHADYEKTSGELKGRLPVKLSKLGIQQAHRLKEFFYQYQIEKFFSSAILRCKQTSEIIADSKLPIQFDKRLLETLTAYQGLMDGEWIDHAYSHVEELGGESFHDVQNRIVDFYLELIEQDYDNVIVCSHGDPLQFLYVYLLGKTLPNDYKKFRNSFSDYQTKASVRLVEVADGQVKKIETIFQQPE